MSAVCLCCAHGRATPHSSVCRPPMRSRRFAAPSERYPGLREAAHPRRTAAPLMTLEDTTWSGGAGIGPSRGYGNFRMTICSPGTSAKSLAFEVSSRKSRWIACAASQRSLTRTCGSFRPFSAFRPGPRKFQPSHRDPQLRFSTQSSEQGGRSLLLWTRSQQFQPNRISATFTGGDTQGLGG